MFRALLANGSAADTEGGREGERDTEREREVKRGRETVEGEGSGRVGSR